MDFHDIDELSTLQKRFSKMEGDGLQEMRRNLMEMVKSDAWLYLKTEMLRNAVYAWKEITAVEPRPDLIPKYNGIMETIHLADKLIESLKPKETKTKEPKFRGVENARI